jgi:nitroreductase
MAEIDLRAAMSTLRAVRRLKSDPIQEQVLDRILEAASWAPTGGNAQPFRIVVVRDRAKMTRLGELYAAGWHEYATGHRALIADAPAPIRDAAEKTFGAGDYLAEHFADTPVLLVFCFNPKNMAITDARLDRVSVVGGASVYPAVQNTLLACRAEGLGCVLTTLLCQCEDEVRTLLQIPEPWGTAAAIPIGMPVLGGHGPISRRPIEKLVFSDTWGQAYGGGGSATPSTS